MIFKYLKVCNLFVTSTNSALDELTLMKTKNLMDVS